MPDQRIEKIDETDDAELYIVGMDSGPFPRTDVLRFDFQRGSVNASKGFVINAGCNEDPAGLRAIFGERVINCDIESWDKTMDRPNAIDKILDITKPWDQFADDSAEMVVFGDVLEHLSYDKIVFALTEAARVARRVCITVPEDHRIPNDIKYTPDTYNPHVTVVTEELLRKALHEAGWKPFVFIQADWGFANEDGHVYGWLVEAHRAVA